MILSAARPVTYLGVDARGSGTGNLPVEVVTSTVFGPSRGLDDEGPDWKTLMSSFTSEGATVKVLSHNCLSMVDRFNDLLVQPSAGT